MELFRDSGNIIYEVTMDLACWVYGTFFIIVMGLLVRGNLYEVTTDLSLIN